MSPPSDLTPAPTAPTAPAPRRLFATPGAWLLLAIVGALLIAQQLLTIPGTSAFSDALQDAMHVPWSAALTLLTHRLTRNWRYTLAIMLSVAIGSECLQIFTDRDASFHDVASDLFGMLAARSLHSWWFNRSLRKAWPALAALALVVVYTMAPMAMVGASHYWLMRHWPVLFDAASAAGSRLATPTADVIDDTPSDAGLLLRLTGERWSGVHLDTFHADDRQFTTLSIDIEVPDDKPLRLGVSLQVRSSTRREIRFVDSRLTPGRQQLEIPLDRLLRDTPWQDALKLYIYGYRTDAGREFVLHTVTLH